MWEISHYLAQITMRQSKEMKCLLIMILAAPGVALAAPGIPLQTMSPAKADKVYTNGVFWVEVVRYNAQHAVRCGMRSSAWANIAINQARTQLTQNGYWMKAYGQVPAGRKSAAQVYSRKLAAQSYAMSCRELATMPLIQLYDGAQAGGFIPMPDLMR
ncbi:hypothetical protein [Novosphingobium sp. NDB2Meth1]|uniref:hypothetical protein n=1 Tax=Novosphingobium sp. NDB2Meth1 TaxID=1892847 RepID=UPI0009318D9E|nr:hypothetical protein [Novosphingobium sp. NDB2Meth1]